ncbi:MAG: hypothetical protein ABL889_15560 [Terricaulis sp.]
MRKFIFALAFSALALGTPARAQVTTTEIETVEPGLYFGRPETELVAAVLGRPGQVRYAFEMLHNGAHVGIIDMTQLTQSLCPSPNRDISGSPLLVRDGVVIAHLSTSPRQILSATLPERPAGERRRDARRGDPAAPLPLASGLDPAIAGASNFNTNVRSGPRTIRCVDYSGRGGSAEGALQSAMIAPFILFRPAENQARENAQVHGAELYDAIALGAPLPADLEASARQAHVGLRTHPGDGAYQVLTIDLGGDRTNGVAQPRSVGYIGVRDGLVQWKALDATGGTFSGILCVSTEGWRGPVRDGCTGTGFYFP